MIAPRALGWRGRHRASALWLDPALLGERACRARILSLWQPGATVRAAAGGYLLQLPQPRRLDAAAGPGLLLVSVRGRLCSAPLSEEEWAALAPPPGALLLVRAGTVEVHDPAAAARVRISDWLDLSALRPEVVEPLGHPPPPPPAVASAASLAELLGILPDAEATALLADLAAADGAGGWTLAGSVSDTVKAWRGAADGMSDALGGLKSALQRSLTWLDALAERSGVMSRMEKAIGKKNAARLRELEALIDRGEAEAAMRKGIPLRRDPSSGGGAMLFSALGSRLADLFASMPDRAGLKLEPRSRTTITSARDPWDPMGAMFRMLEEMYRRSFEQLDAAGKIREAAYVLDELLDEPEEAVRYLAEHGELTLAAELAERRGRPVGEVVALWLRAGDRPRALLLARLRDGFAPAIALLEEDDPALGGWLRTRWATFLARSGRYAAAVEVAWPLSGVPSAAARGWLDKAIALGGPGSAQALRMKLERCPEAQDELRTQLRPMLSDASPGGPLLRLALARELSGVPAARGLARPLARRILTDQIDRGSPEGTKLLSALCAVVDPALGADLPKLKNKAPLPELIRGGRAPLAVDVSAGDTGLHRVYDALPLPGGGVVAALGPAGVSIFDEAGRRLASLDVPVTDLVSTTGGARALGLAPRGSTIDLYHLDLVARTASLAGSMSRHRDGMDRDESVRRVAVSRWASSHDGHTLAVSSPHMLALLSVLPGEPVQLLWSSAVPPAARIAYGPLAWSPTELTQLMASPDSLQHWRYPLPGPQEPVTTKLHSDAIAWPVQPHVLLGSRAARLDRDGLLIARAGAGAERVAPDVLAEVLGAPPHRILASAGHWLVIGAGEAAHLWQALVPRPSGRRLVVTLPDATILGARLEIEAGVLLVYDDLGRVLVISLQDGALLSSVRA